MALASIAAAIAAAGALAGAAGQQAVFRGRSDAVVIDVAVTDGRTPVTHLTLQDFELRDNGVVQTILDFDRGTLPLDVTLTIDISGSMTKQKRAAVERAIAQVSGALAPADRAAVVTFSGSVSERAPLRPPPIAADLPVTGTRTSVFDALLASLVTAPSLDRRQLTIFMTDGDDTSSFFDARTVLQTARHASAQFSFVVVRGGGTRADGAVMSVFRTIAGTTGGTVLEIDDDDRLSEAFLAALASFRTSYVLRYAPTGVAGAGWHDVAVGVKRGTYTVRARRGYWRSELLP
jgi:VWFA-related protein